jgi:hypothetical protein
MEGIPEANPGFLDYKEKAKLYNRIIIPAQT